MNTIPHSKWKLNRANWDLYQELLQGRLSNLTIGGDVDTTLAQLNHMIVESAKIAIGKTSNVKRRRVVPWWNQECDQAIKQSKHALNYYRKHKTIENLIELKRKRAYTKLITTGSKKAA